MQKKKYMVFYLILILASILTIINIISPVHVQAAKSRSPKPKPTPTPTLTPTPTQLPSITPTPTKVASITPTPTKIPSSTDLTIKGINYNPIAAGTSQLDETAPLQDVSQMYAMGANVIGTYNAGMFEWGNYTNVNINQTFYNNLSSEAEKYGMKIIVGYFANESIDWKNVERVKIVTEQYKKLVTETMNRPSTHSYLIGNELFEKLPDDASRIEYAKWVGQMVAWTHSINPELEVSYADNHALYASFWLKQYASNLDYYSINTYEWTNSVELIQVLDRFEFMWPNLPFLLHEWGVDSYDYQARAENEILQSDRIAYLYSEIEKALQLRPNLMGSVYFEYSDQWDKVGSISTQDNLPVSWRCTTCFDGVANEDYWGLVTNTQPGLSNLRRYKPAFNSLKTLWNR